MALHIYNPKSNEFSRNLSGYARSVWDISRSSAANGNEEYLYTFDNRDKKTLETVKIISNNIFSFFKYVNLQTIKYTFFLIVNFFNFKNRSYKERLYYIFSNFTQGYLNEIIRETKPDIINIHGLTFSTLPFISAAINQKVPFVVTLHGLNINRKNNNLEKEFEIKSIESLNKSGVYIILTGSRMLTDIKKNCQLTDDSLFITINEGIDKTSFEKYDKKTVMREYGIEGKKILISVGALTEDRNQIALVSAISELKQSTKDKIKVFIIGKGNMEDSILREIKNKNLSDIVELTGYLKQKDISKYYSIADITIVLSKVEGFGRPILESYLYGVPVIAFSDLDAVNDLYKEGCMFKIERSGTQEVAKNIEAILKKDTDKTRITEFANSMSWNVTIEKYQEIYNKIITTEKSNTSYKYF